MSYLFALFTLLSFLPPLAIGFLLLSLFWTQDKPVFSDLPLKCCLSVGFGFGASSCLVFLWMMIVGRLTRGFFVCELMLAVGLSVLLARRKRASISTAADQPKNVFITPFKSPYLLRLAVCVASLSAAIRFWFLSRQDPHGQFDAFAIWNLRARFLYRGGQHWKNFTDLTGEHSDYPMLIPASIARSWEFIGREAQLIPCAIGLLFTFATIGIVFTFISRLRGERQGLLAGLILLGTPFLITHGASQYADVPLSFFFVATVALLFLQAESPSRMHFLILAGMAAAFSAWTKNEGILFLLLLFFLYFVIAILVNGGKRCGSELVALLMGAAPVIVVVLIYKMGLSASNDLIAAQGLGYTDHLLFNTIRYRIVLSRFVRELFSFGGWNSTLAMPLLLLFYFLVLGSSVRKKEVAATSIAVLLPVSMMVGYFFAYIVSPYDLTWHLDSSLNRLLLQVWPLAIFAYFVIVRSPDRALRAYRDPPRAQNSGSPALLGAMLP
jgi:4-amino-4-deoxy-L-arabinose transferase-like glycosyltransferase